MGIIVRPGAHQPHSGGDLGAWLYARRADDDHLGDADDRGFTDHDTAGPENDQSLFQKQVTLSPQETGFDFVHLRQLSLLY